MHVCRVNWAVKQSVWACLKSRLKAYLSPRFWSLCGQFSPLTSKNPMTTTSAELMKALAASASVSQGRALSESGRHVHEQRIYLCSSQESAPELPNLPDICQNRADDCVLIWLYLAGSQLLRQLAVTLNSTGFAALKTFVWEVPSVVHKVIRFIYENLHFCREIQFWNHYD